MDSIILSRIRALGTHGVLPEEQSRPQPFEIDVELYADLTRAGQSDVLSDTVDYDSVIERTVKIVEAERFALLEALAARIADDCRSDPRVTRAVVTVRKLRPPVGHQVDHVAVRVER